MKRIERSDSGRFLTFSCYRRLPLFHNDAIKDLFVERLAETRVKHRVHVYAWVVMPEHVHLIVRCPDESTVTDFLSSLKSSVARRVIRRWKELDASVLRRVEAPDGKYRFWQRGGGYDRNLIKGPELFSKIEYVHRNPVRRGLVETPTDWAWSSARWWGGMREGEFGCDPIR